MRILIGGDFAPTTYNFELFRNSEKEKLYGEKLLEYASGFDYRVFDFECCLGEKGDKEVRKFGPVITAPYETINGVACIKPSLMILANNHAYNLLNKGLVGTISALQKEGIYSCGAGTNLSDARKPYVFEKDGVRVGIYACAEHEFNYAKASNGGVNPYDPLYSYDDVAELKKSCDQVIVIYHGGLIEFRYPLPNERRRLKRFIEKGADLVIGQHTHCVGAEEEFKGKKIIYGQGDFFFARPTRNEYRESGLLLDLDISKDAIKVGYEVRILDGDTVRLATSEERDEVLKKYGERNEILKDENLFLGEYKKMLNERRNIYLSALIGRKRRGILYRGLNKITNRVFGSKYMELNYGTEDWLCLTNFTECETHYEILSDLFKEGWDIE